MRAMFVARCECYPASISAKDVGVRVCEANSIVELGWVVSREPSVVCVGSKVLKFRCKGADSRLFAEDCALYSALKTTERGHYHADSSGSPICAQYASEYRDSD